MHPTVARVNQSYCRFLQFIQKIFFLAIPPWEHALYCNVLEKFFKKFLEIFVEFCLQLLKIGPKRHKFSDLQYTVSTVFPIDNFNLLWYTVKASKKFFFKFFVDNISLFTFTYLYSYSRTVFNFH